MDSVLAVFLKVVQVDEQKCQGRQALLAVDDEVLPILVTDDDRTQSRCPSRRCRRR